MNFRKNALSRTRTHAAAVAVAVVIEGICGSVDGLWWKRKTRRLEAGP